MKLLHEERLCNDSLGVSTTSNVVSNTSSSSSLAQPLVGGAGWTWLPAGGAESPPGMNPMLLRRFSLVSDCSGSERGVASSGGTMMVGG